MATDPRDRTDSALEASFPGTSDSRGWTLQTEQYIRCSKLRETWVIPKLKKGEEKEK
ncbi:hypothetical protein PAAG_03714 [Paracoccidioides lutzii Pb01]|uniref:Uncharacterized protein n=1 Tax=Paracoccidioides lutzii (strain ATCC MYA-826 / Pb01) TaxID=502779 RepID=C1GYX0_PARBA|nr:hypothetical protein PAAG_03714 [Paracoccidioides lutzii Pb01]EEH41793.2 hypothetical protein PAAG_03714 [Paracoccidioides lutzii Pb01]